MDPVLVETNNKIHSAIDHLKQELSSIRAGRANPTLIENIPVSVYGSRLKLLELGTISAPQPSLLTIQVWDVSVVQDIVKAIQEANLGLNPSSEGQMIRLPIPALTAQRRTEYIKLVHAKMEQTRVEIRQIRQSTRERWQSDQESGEFGEDELDRRTKLLQNLVDKASGQVEEIGNTKEQELLQM